MSQQIQITGGAKVRNLEGVLTGTAGVVNALGINVPSGIPQLDGSGKILVSQLPNSVMEYKGTWNAATNTPTLVNGTGNQGDVYLVSVAGTVNFGAGPITFAVGDQAIYSGTIWQKAGGSTGTVTSVAVTETGDALTITGSPITTSGTINIGFAGTSGQYVNGAGGLTTFPSLTGFVPYTGATANLDLGTFDLTTDIINLNQLKAIGSGGLNIYSNSGTHIALMGGGGGAGTTFYGGIIGTTASFASSGGSDTFAINHSSGSGIALNITKGGAGEGLYINKTSGSGNAATITGGVTLLSELHLTTDLADAYIASAATWNAKQNTITLTTTGTSGVATLVGATLNIPNYTTDLSNYVTLNGIQTITGEKTFANNTLKLAATGTGGLVTFLSNISGTGLTSSGSNALGFNINNDIYFAGSAKGGGVFVFNNTAVRNYTLKDANGTLAFTSDIPSLSGYIQGSGTTNYVPKFTASGTIGNSSITDASSLVTITSDLRVTNASGSGAVMQMYSNGADDVLFQSILASTGGNKNILYYGADLLWFTGTLNVNGASERMRITQAGNVGIGLTNPTSKLHIATSSADAFTTLETNSGFSAYNRNKNGNRSWVYGVDGTSSSWIVLDETAGAVRMAITSGGNVGIGTSSPVSYGTRNLEVNGGSGSSSAYIVVRGTSDSIIGELASDGAIYLSSKTAHPLIIRTSDVERMRITSGGNVLINGTTPTGAGISTSGTLQVFKEIYSGGSLSGLFFENRSTPATTTTNWYGWYASSNTIFLYSIGGGGNIGNFNTSTGGYTPTSDINRKKDLELYTKSGLDAILGLKPTLYRMKTEDESTEKHLGFIAQEVKDFIPQAYVETIADKKDGEVHIGLDYQAITVNLVKAIQEQQAQIEELKAKIK